MESNRKNMKDQGKELYREMIFNDPDFQRKSEIRAIDEAVMKDLSRKKIHKPLSINERLIFSH